MYTFFSGLSPVYSPQKVGNVFWELSAEYSYYFFIISILVLNSFYLQTHDKPYIIIIIFYFIYYQVLILLGNFKAFKRYITLSLDFLLYAAPKK